MPDDVVQRAGCDAQRDPGDRQGHQRRRGRAHDGEVDARLAAAIGSQVHVAGTSTPSARTCWLPVPRSPLTRQVSSITTCSRGTTASRMPGGPPDSSAYRQLSPTQVACSTPVMKPHRPVTRNPSDPVASADPLGEIAPATIVPGSANSSSKVPRGRCTMSTQALDPIITVHPTDASARDRASTACSWSASVPSAPPWLRGRSIPKQPELASSATRSGGSRRAASVSAARADSSGARNVDRGQDLLGRVRDVLRHGLAHGSPQVSSRGVTGGWAEAAGDAAAGAGSVPPRRAASGAPRPSPRCSTRSSRRSARRARCRRAPGGR